MSTKLEWQREYRKKNNNYHTKQYEKTKKGFLMRLYRNMKSRITGVQKLKYHLYQGKVLLDKETFYTWALSSPTFHSLWEEYEGSGWSSKLSPSVDRKDSTKGYEINNMEWVTHSENSRRGNVSRQLQKRIS